jgi:hypothetical protein
VHTSLLWPLAALVVTGLTAARTLHGRPLPDDGTLAAPASALLHGEHGPSPVSPEGLGAAHTAVYATVTRAFQRHASLVVAERELLLVLLLVTAVLLWRTARRLDVPDGACAVAVLVLGALPALAPVQAVATPAAFAVVWLRLAGWLGSITVTTPRPPAAVAALTVLAAALAVLLAPDALLLLVAGGAAAAASTARSRGRRTGIVLTGLVLLAAVRVLLPRWDPQADQPSRWGGSATALLLLSGVLVVVGLLAARRLPHLRAAGTALTATVLLAVAPPSGRLPALLLCIPLAALLVGALVATAAERVLRRSPRATVIAGLAGAALLLGTGTAAATGFAGGERSDFGAAAAGRLVRWADEQLPVDAVLTASPPLAAELVHVGADPAQVRVGGNTPAPVPAGEQSMVLQVTSGAVPAGSAAVASFGDLEVSDPRAVPPTAEQVTVRRQLGAALLANPTVEVPPAGARLLSAGQVDPRLLTLLASIGAQYGFGLQSLAPAPGEAPQGLVRQTVISSVGGRQLADDPAATERLGAWLDAQRQPYLPDRVRTVDGGLLIGYQLVPDPDALVTPPGGR